MKARSYRSLVTPRGTLAGSLAVLTWLIAARVSAQDAAPAPAAPAPGFEKAKAADRRKTLFDKMDALRKKRADSVKAPVNPAPPP